MKKLFLIFLFLPILLKGQNGIDSTKKNFKSIMFYVAERDSLQSISAGIRYNWFGTTIGYGYNNLSGATNIHADLNGFITLREYNGSFSWLQLGLGIALQKVSEGEWVSQRYYLNVKNNRQIKPVFSIGLGFSIPAIIIGAGYHTNNGIYFQTGLRL